MLLNFQTFWILLGLTATKVCPFKTALCNLTKSQLSLSCYSSLKCSYLGLLFCLNLNCAYKTCFAQSFQGFATQCCVIWKRNISFSRLKIVSNVTNNKYACRTNSEVLHDREIALGAREAIANLEQEWPGVEIKNNPAAGINLDNVGHHRDAVEAAAAAMNGGNRWGFHV